MGGSGSKVKVQPQIDATVEVPRTKQSEGYSSVEEKPSSTEHQDDYLKSLALGEMKNGWGDQYRDYDGTLKEVGKNRQMKVEWSDDEVKPQVTPMKTPVKQPAPQQRPTPPSKPRPPPPMHRPSNALAQKPATTVPVSHTVVYAPPSSVTPPHGHRIASFTPERCISSDEDADTVHSSGMNTNEHLQALYQSTRPTNDIIHHMITSSSNEDGDYMAEFSGDSTKTPTRARPDSVPPLNLESPVAAPPSTPSFKPSPPIKHPPTRPLTVNVNMQATLNPSPSPHATPSNARYTTPTRAARPSGPNPTPPPRPMQTRHAVKETKDVKRNRAQLPATLTHAKPTTGDWLKKRYIVNNYILLDTLGTGSYAEVRLCKERTTDILYAMKIVSKDMLNKKKGGRSTETYMEDIKREIAIMKQLLHPNVLRLFEVNKLYLVLEYMKKGDLLNYLKDRDIAADDTERTEKRKSKTFSPLSDHELWIIFKQVVAGVRYLHYQNIVHGDIKPQNLLVSEDGIVKIADFGISKMLVGSAQKVEDAGGTPAFMAPELCEEKPFSGQLADVWAIGATMFMLRYGHPPFMANTILGLYHKIINDPLEFPSAIDPGLHNLLQCMLEKDPQQRYSMDQVASHPWMRFPPPPPQIPKGVQDAKRLQYSEGVQDEAAAAMKRPIKDVDKDEVFRSIGYGLGQKMQETSDDEEKDIEEEESKSVEDVMTTDWGLDVFEKVDDDEFHSDSEDEEDESTEEPPAKPRPIVAKHDRKNSGGDELPPRPSIDESNSRSHSSKAMAEDEEARRAKIFRDKAEHKMRSMPARDYLAIQQMQRDAATTSDDSTRDLIELPKGKRVLSVDVESGVYDSDGLELTSGKSGVQELSMDEFEAMMDTLAMRPSLIQRGDTSPEGSPHAAPLVLNNIQLPSHHTNCDNGVGGATYSAKGTRKEQEDRSVLFVSMAEVAAEEDRERLAMFSVACVFDGHSGHTCSQYLCQNVSQTLLSHPSFYGKSMVSVLTDTCASLDENVCAMLRSHACDSAGSTGVIAIYDGRSNIFTVANVGDSMCVLSRCGKAINIHKTHRVSDEDPEELERIKQAGGSVFNKRVNGIIAISRAFGDVQFKDATNPSNSVIVANPDVHAEVITPMTEFAILGSDGLWDSIDPQAAVNFVRKRINRKMQFQAIVEELVEEALDRGSVDNVTATILVFHLNRKGDSGNSLKSKDLVLV